MATTWRWSAHVGAPAALLMETMLKQSFQLPDERIKVGRERFEASEVHFDSDKAGVEGRGPESQTPTEDPPRKSLGGSVLAGNMKEQEFWLQKR